MIETFDPKSKNIISLTDGAIIHFKKWLAKDDSKKYIRISIKTTGCSGLSYVVEAILDVPENHDILIISNLSIYIDKKAKSVLDGLIIDHKVGQFGLSQLIYSNPNESARCGCGESFTIKTEEK